MLTDEYRYKVLKLLDANPNLSQRQLARELGISVGKVNYCLKALVERGMIKAANFKNSQNKKAYSYLLTPEGLEHKAKVAVRFLRHKMAEHKNLQAEIAALREEVGNLEPESPSKQEAG
ncbi:MarR family EPS-associated transcriptional regulator [Marinimicrobium sp. ABcell2]|uniref:MarR family EPS-associated transcriptional regulator n=1 Tax=Marinimicrobium sp. ABcell2 TaxID=3069751 RepID=UPI0027B45482|nr:MarR family EPS-associated transcriptional regulator [Marinimicrobium sp. ABcell2]MDQ2078317.1 MarR family EPS-associated transcriptional regulator [Marinimicrobium sp. ABcell2]